MALISLERLQLAMQGIKIAMQDLQDKLKTKLDKSDYLQADLSQDDVTAANYVKNRPFYDTRKLEPIEFTFDGNLEGKETVELRPNEWAVKISDDAYPADTFLGGQLSVFVGGNVAEIPEITEEHIQPADSLTPPSAYSILDSFIVVLTDELSEHIPFPKGTWTFCAKDDAGNVLFYGKSISGQVETGELKKLDEKYIPDTIMRTPSEDDALELVAELGIAEPMTDDEGNVLTDENGVLFLL